MQTPSNQEIPAQETKDIEIVVNGESRRVPPGMVLFELLQLLKVEPARVAVEHNREIIKKTDWNRTPIRSGDEIEVVQFVGGG